MNSAVVQCFTVSILVAATSFACHRDRGRSDENVATTEIAETEHRPPSDKDRAGEATLTGASWVTNEAAIDRITALRCTRELSCGNVGRDQRYASSDVCTREVRRKLETDLRASNCPTGIDGNKLDACVDAIQSQSCATKSKPATVLTACRTSELCLKVEMPHR
ncbi:MAG TPA: DUF6184 family natural product biosynthesis lipoprotein [Labilithrix sp.]|jgi:hypothetical protein|nr:DUF6184 family natural product biosynthesis lipoprotein [Labilithrix sp.]